MMRRILPMALIALLALSAVAASRWSEDAKKRKADYLYLEATSLQVQEQHDAAYELLREALRLNPDDEVAAADLALFQLQLDGKDNATFTKSMADLERYIKLHPDDYYNTVTYGRLLEYKGENEKALEVWKGMRRQFPDRAPVALKLAEALIDTGDSTNMREAIALYDSLLETEGFNSQLLMRKLQMLYAIDDTSTIVNEVKTLVSSPGGRTVDNLVLAGSVSDALNHSDAALDYYQQACELDPSSGLARYSLANYYYEAGDTAGYDREIYQALISPTLEPEIKDELLHDYVTNHIEDPGAEPRMDELFNILVDQYPHDSSIRNSFASYLIYKQRYDEGAEQISYALDIEPDQAQQWRALVQLYNLTEDYDRAIETADNALRYFPDDPELYSLKAYTYNTIEEYDSAIEAINTAIEINSRVNTVSETALKSTLGDILYASGDVDNAFAIYDEVIAADPDNALALNNYAYYLSLEGRDLDKAQEMAERSLRISPDNLNTVDTYAWVMFVKKDFKRAREIYDSAIDKLLDEDNATAEAYEHAGDIYFMTGDRDQAVEFWREALDIDPENELLQRKVKHETYFIK